MHLSDGVLSNPVLIAALDAIGIGAAVLVVRRRPDVEQRPFWTGTLAAFVLAAQAINLPVGPGASAHAIGAGLLAFTLGTADAVLALAAVLVVQALLFADGGISVLGINLLNIAVIPVLTVDLVRRVFGTRRPALAAFTGTALGNILGATSLALTLVIGTGVRPVAAFGWLLGVQTVAGLVEGALTAAAVRQLATRAPALLVRREPASVGARWRGFAWALACFALALVLVPFATDVPDALARALGQAGP